MSKKDQPKLFGEEVIDEATTWRKEWQGMPEFRHEDTAPFQKIIVNFKTKEDVKKFAELTGIKITYKTNSIWYPKIEYPAKQTYKDES